jgi:hypothetical protein
MVFLGVLLVISFAFVVLPSGARALTSGIDAYLADQLSQPLTGAELILLAIGLAAVAAAVWKYFPVGKLVQQLSSVPHLFRFPVADAPDLQSHARPLATEDDLPLALRLDTFLTNPEVREEIKERVQRAPQLHKFRDYEICIAADRVLFLGLPLTDEHRAEIMDANNGLYYYAYLKYLTHPDFLPIFAAWHRTVIDYARKHGVAV